MEGLELRRMEIDEMRKDLHQQALARDTAARERALQKETAMNKWGSQEEREQLHNATLRKAAYQRRAYAVRVLHGVATLVGLIAIIGSFQFVSVTEGNLYCDGTPFRDTAAGLQECLQFCFSKQGQTCTAIEDWGRVSYFLYAGILTLDAAHNLVSAFGEGVIPVCTKRYYETSCPTYSLKFVAWAAVVAYTGLSLITYREVAQVQQLAWVAGGSIAYLFISIMVMVGESKLRRGAAHLRAAESVELELLRQHHMHSVPDSPSHEKELDRRSSHDRRSGSAYFERSSRGSSRHDADKVSYVTIDHGRRLNGYQQRLRDAKMETNLMRTQFGVRAAEAYDNETSSLTAEVARVRKISAQVAADRQAREQGRPTAYGLATSPKDRRVSSASSGYLQVGGGGP